MSVQLQHTYACSTVCVMLLHHMGWNNVVLTEHGAVLPLCHNAEARCAQWHKQHAMHEQHSIIATTTSQQALRHQLALSSSARTDSMLLCSRIRSAGGSWMPRSNDCASDMLVRTSDCMNMLGVSQRQPVSSNFTKSSMHMT
eukprot:360002-Chlamydomonas_euryale.AAC.7